MRKISVVVISAAWLIFIFFAIDGFINVVLRERPVSSSCATGSVEVVHENINYGNDYLTVDICRPAVFGFLDKVFELELNRRISVQISSALSNAQNYAETDGLSIGYDCVFYAVYSAKCTTGVLSLKVTTLLDNGGTGMPKTVYYNVDIKGNRMIALNDLFKDGALYGERIDAVILAEMRKDPERYFFERYTGVDENTQFFIYNGNLNIAFAKYEIASGMTGEPYFMIPTEVIVDMLAQEFKVFFI